MLRPYSRGHDLADSVFVPVRQTRRRYAGGKIPVGRRDRTGRAAPCFSCAVHVHSSSQTFFRQNSRRCPGSLPSRATPESGARKASSTDATVAAWPPRETPPEESPPCPAANSSARDSLPAAAPLPLQARPHSAAGAVL